jgi:hypothetical protein
LQGARVVERGHFHRGPHEIARLLEVEAVAAVEEMLEPRTNRRYPARPVTKSRKPFWSLGSSSSKYRFTSGST